MFKQRATYLKRKTRQQCTLVLTIFLSLFGCTGAALGSVTSSSWSNGTYTIEATISAPDTARENVDFDVNVGGAISAGSAFDVYAYAVYENAVWSYNQNHMIEISSGNLVEGRGFNLGAAHAGTYTFNKPPGVYTYTYVFGFRKMGHNYFDIAVDVTVIVSPANN
jgi:hypothetical protein